MFSPHSLPQEPICQPEVLNEGGELQKVTHIFHREISRRGDMTHLTQCVCSFLCTKTEGYSTITEYQNIINIQYYQRLSQENNPSWKRPSSTFWSNLSWERKFRWDYLVLCPISYWKSPVFSLSFAIQSPKALIIDCNNFYYIFNK